MILIAIINYKDDMRGRTLIWIAIINYKDGTTDFDSHYKL